MLNNMLKAALLATLLTLAATRSEAASLKHASGGRLNLPGRRLLQPASAVFPPLTPPALPASDGSLPAAVSPAAESLAAEFRLSEEQGAVLESIYGNPSDPAATIEADLESSGIDVAPPQPFPAPLPEDNLFDYGGLERSQLPLLFCCFTA